MVDEYDRYVSGHGMYDFMLISSSVLRTWIREAILGENYIVPLRAAFRRRAGTGADGTKSI